MRASDFVQKDKYGVDDLRLLVAALRAEDGCPWDKVQTHRSIRRDFLEECYELAEAIDEDDAAHLREELGDVLMHVFFHAGIEEDAGRFDADEVADAECKKLIFRHPHVFSGGKADTPEEVLSTWDELKRREKGQSSHTDAMKAVCRVLPALWRAEKVQNKASKAGFDSYGADGAADKLLEEAEELRWAAPEDMAEEMGDVLFSAVSMCRFAGLDPEAVLNAATDKFIRRFEYVEQAAREKGLAPEELSPELRMELWRGAKSENL